MLAALELAAGERSTPGGEMVVCAAAVRAKWDRSGRASHLPNSQQHFRNSTTGDGHTGFKEAWNSGR